MNKVDAALNYLDLGFSVLPLSGKKALTAWTKYQTSPPSIDQVLKWWDEWPDANVGIITGAVSNSVVLDYDDPPVATKYLKKWEGPVSKTPKGYHGYYAHIANVANAVRKIPGVDIRSDGGYVVAPPSVVGGHTYKWLTGLCEAKDLPQAPDEIRSILVNAHEPNPLHIAARNLGFTEGVRDDTLFHIANILRKGGMPYEEIVQVVTFLGQHTIPPFPASEIKIKIDSAFRRGQTDTLTADIRSVLESTTGVFSLQEIYQTLRLQTPEARTHTRVVLARMVKDGVIERLMGRAGMYRLVDDSCAPINWQNCPIDFVDLWLPLGLDQMAGIQPGNILVFAGAKDAGKTTWAMHTALTNSRNWDVHYFSSEMGGSEFCMRVKEFGNAPGWDRVKFYERGEDFQDVIKSGSGKLNIIDYLEVTKDFYLAGDAIAKIFRRLDGAIALICLQKAASSEKQAVTLGTGGRFSIEKARLYIALDRGSAKIVSCKYRHPKSQYITPGGMIREFVIRDNGTVIKPIGDWGRET